MSIPRRIHRRVPNSVPISPVVWQPPQTPNPPPNAPDVLKGDLDLTCVHSQMNPQTWTWCQSVQPFDRFPRLLNVWPLKPPPKCPLCLEGQFVWRISIPGWICRCVSNLKGDLYLAYVHSQMNPQMWTKVGANRTASPAFWIVDPLKPPKCPMCLEDQFVWRISIPIWICTCAKFGANRPSRLVAFPEFVLRLVRLFAAVRADSRKNMPKNNMYTSKIIIPARTCRHQLH